MKPKVHRIQKKIKQTLTCLLCLILLSAEGVFASLPQSGDSGQQKSSSNENAVTEYGNTDSHSGSTADGMNGGSGSDTGSQGSGSGTGSNTGSNTGSQRSGSDSGNSSSSQGNGSDSGSGSNTQSNSSQTGSDSRSGNDTQGSGSNTQNSSSGSQESGNGGGSQGSGNGNGSGSILQGGNKQDSDSRQSNTDSDSRSNADSGSSDTDTGRDPSRLSQDDILPSDGYEEKETGPDWAQELITGGGETSDGFATGPDGLENSDPDYTGRLDPFTGQPAGTSEGESVGEGRVQIGDHLFYDNALGGFLYYSELFQTEIMSNVADGMIVTDPVSVTMPDGLTYTLYKDGQTVEDPDLTKIREPGNYRLVLGQGTATEELIAFTIVDRITGAISYYSMPAGFIVDSVTINDVRQKTAHSRVNMLKEGTYEIRYSCPKAGAYFSLKTIIDHTPPSLTFYGLSQNRTARGKVRWEGLGPGETVTVVLDGKEVQIGRNELVNPGNYVITVTDQAKNQTVYAVTVLLYVKTKGLLLGGIMICLISAALYMLFERKRLRVR